MQPFSIDYITGTAGASYSSQYTLQGHGPESDDDIVHSQNDVGLYYATPHLDDVYSVISKDASLTSLTPPPTSLLEVNCGEQSKDALDRGTPSPNRDSGIESDNSPSVAQTTEMVSKTLRALDKKADAVKAKSSSAPKDKPPQSYIALIAMAILSSRDRKLTLGDIYRHIMDNHSYYNNDEKAWRNSIRYNLSINECFIKCGKEESGKGHFWGVHPQCIDDFAKGDYRRRQARRRAKRGMKVASTNVIPEKSSASRNITYTPMTPSFVAYHPYGPAGVHQSNQSAYGKYNSSEIAHAYTGHQSMALPVSYYEAPAAGYSPQPLTNAYSYQPGAYPGYMATPYGYIHQQYTSTEAENHSDGDSKDTNSEYESKESKWYGVQSVPQSSPPRDNTVPYNNTIILS